MQSTYIYREVIRQRIDDEILELRLRISNLASQRNTLAPITHLPPEVLSRIFIEYRDQAKGLELKHSPDTLTWVCQRWRDVAIGCASLWTYIDSHHPPFVELYLTRSKNAALEIEALKCLLPEDIPITTTILQQLNRIHGLGLIYEGNRQPQLPELWGLAAPRLQALVLENFCLPDDIFNGISPLLQSLSLSFCVVPWRAPLFSTLTTLVLAKPVNCISINHFLCILENSPHLAELDLENVFDGDMAITGRSAETPLILPNLRTLAIPNDDYVPLSCLLRHLSLPGLTQASINVYSLTGNATTSSADFLQASFASIFSSRPISQLSLTYGFQEFTVKVLGRDLSAHDQSKELRIELQVHIPNAPIPDISTISTAHLNLAFLEHLTLSLDDSATVQFDLFNNLPRLRILEVEGFAASKLIDFFIREGKQIASGWPDTLTDYKAAISSQANIKASTLTPNMAGLSFQALEHLKLSLPFHSITSSNLPQGHEKWFIFNFYARRICGIGLKKVEYFNWIIRSWRLLEVACRAVDNMQRQNAIEIERFNAA